MNFFLFTLDDYENIVKKAMLNEEYSKILEMKIKDYSRVKIADELGMSVDNLDKKISKLTKKIKKVL